MKLPKKNLLKSDMYINLNVSKLLIDVKLFL